MLYRRFLKRPLDLTLSLIALIILSPLLALISVLVAARLGRPIVFTQTRPGLHGKPFTIYKFRTMTDERDAEGNLLQDADRLTRFGRFLRSTSLDELPELFNVLKGDMSLVGPRPLLMQYLDRYTPEQARRHEVRPGITGLAQVKGRQEIVFSRRLAYDIEYIDNLSLSLDLRILYTTVRQVFSRSGVIPGQDVSDVDDLGLSSPHKRSEEQAN